jgi:LuxR family maltose regulon positive regulatory protein
MEPRLLATKLYVPVTRAACVPRPRLQALLERGVVGPLTLLSAPAGSGKTTLVANWLRSSERSAAWFSLDERDNDLARFLRYFVAAIARHHEGFGDELLVDPKAVGLEDPFDLATDLVNEIAQLDADLVVVLDDVHVIDDERVGEVLSFVVDACPPNLHLMMTTRVDPALPLSRMRARGQLTEVRAPELRFTREESAAFLGDVMGVTLSEVQVARLESRTEGWAVGLQMAALSLQGREDAESFIEGFAGSHRYVLDYLMDEVLQRLPGGSRSFLMQTSILRQLTAPLVDAVTQREDGASVLDSLERSNVFTIPLDSRRTAYRYHHLFGTLLRHELEASVSAEELCALHSRASEALEAEGQCEEAVDHALLAGDNDRAARLLKPLVMSSTIRGESHALERLIARFPPEYADANPVVALLDGWLDYYQFKFSALSTRLGRLRETRGRELSSELAAELDLLIGMVAAEAGDLDTAVAQLEKVEALPPDRPYLHSFESMHRAVLALMQDRMEEAREELDRTRVAVRPTNDAFAAVWVEWQVAHVDLLRGKLQASKRVHDLLLDQVMKQYSGAPPSSVLVGFGTGIYLALHQHDLARAEELSTIAGSLGKGLSRRHGYVSCLLMPRALMQVQKGQGEDWGATLDQAIRHLDALDQMTSVPRIEAQRVRLAMHPRSGVDPRRVVKRWLELPGIRNGTHEVYRPNPMPGVQVDHPRFVLARALALVGDLDAASAVARELFTKAMLASRQLCQVEARLLQVEIVALRGEDADLSIAVDVAASEHMVGPFLEFEALLPRAIDLAHTRGHRTFAKALEDARRAPCTKAQPVIDAVAEPDVPAPADALSDRELEVLGLVAMGLSNAEASRKLFIAPSTVKKHLEHIYGKLGVNRRTQAVARARTLGLIQA